MEAYIAQLLSKYGDSLAIIVCIAFLYIKVNFLTLRVTEVQKDVKDHIKYHLQKNDKEGD